MIYLYSVLGVLAAASIFVLGVGIYEFYVEDKQDRAYFKRMDNQLHLKHLDEINNGSK